MLSPCTFPLSLDHILQSEPSGSWVWVLRYKLVWDISFIMTKSRSYPTRQLVFLPSIWVVSQIAQRCCSISLPIFLRSLSMGSKLVSSCLDARLFYLDISVYVALDIIGDERNTFISFPITHILWEFEQALLVWPIPDSYYSEIIKVLSSRLYHLLFF